MCQRKFKIVSINLKKSFYPEFRTSIQNISWLKVKNDGLATCCHETLVTHATVQALPLYKMLPTELSAQHQHKTKSGRKPKVAHDQHERISYFRPISTIRSVFQPTVPLVEDNLVLVQPPNATALFFRALYCVTQFLN